MGIHKLHIFAKNRDAIAAQKGYSFQQLKTLEDWIEARIANTGDDIYCDYEDDILARNIEEGKTIFKQLKLYSTDFSFASDSIKKAIAHFFMLYTKGEYVFDQTEFLFETNVSIVKREVRDNDAALLKEWYESQAKLDQALVDRIRVRVKKIIDDYINATTEEIGQNTELKADLQQARYIYDNLKNEDFDGFIRCVKWNFDDLEPNEAVDQLVEHINELIPHIPLPLDGGRTQIYTALLVTEVFHRAMQDNPEDRKLTSELLDAVILNAGEQEDKWYADTIQQFKNFKVNRFFPGELQAIMNAARFSRWNQMDGGHQEIWLSLLRHYIELEEAPVASKRKAIYEYLFLKIGHSPFEEREESAIAGDMDLVNFYFTHCEKRTRLSDIEDDIVLLQLLKAQIIRFSLPVKPEDIFTWQGSLQAYLDDQIAKEVNTDRLCELLELRGHWTKQADISKPLESFKASFDYYRKITPLLDKAQFYSLARLYAQMKEMIEMMATYGIDGGLNNMVDKFMLEIQPYAEKTGLRHQSAHEFIERAARHLEHPDLSNYLKALDLFQRAKGLWRSEFTIEGYILALLNTAQVYDSLGMSYASKYYALAALWTTWHSADGKLYKRLHQALGIVQHLDYRHGAWMNAIVDFNHYLFAKREFDEKGFDIYDDQIFHKSVFEIGAIVHAVPIIHPEMSDFIETLKAQWGGIWTDHIRPVVEKISEKIKDLTAIKPVLDNALVDQPLNDVGPIRNIRFNALGNDWHIQFANNEAMTAIAEEFVSFLQITLCELTYINGPAINGGKQISIAIEQGHFQKELTGNNTWTVTIPAFDSAEQAHLQQHYAYLGSLVKAILHNLSGLPQKEFDEFFIDQLMKKRKLSDKLPGAGAYQRIFNNSIGASLDQTKGRSTFTALDRKTISVTYPQYLSDIK